jgi:hypothetical protein
MRPNDDRTCEGDADPKNLLLRTKSPKIAPMQLLRYLLVGGRGLRSFASLFLSLLDNCIYRWAAHFLNNNQHCQLLFDRDVYDGSCSFVLGRRM